MNKLRASRCRGEIAGGDGLAGDIAHHDAAAAPPQRDLGEDEREDAGEDRGERGEQGARAGVARGGAGRHPNEMASRGSEGADGKAGMGAANLRTAREAVASSP